MTNDRKRVNTVFCSLRSQSPFLIYDFLKNKGIVFNFPVSIPCGGPIFNSLPTLRGALNPRGPIITLRYKSNFNLT